MKKITLVIPTYNVAGYLEQTLASLRAQTADFELWIIDDVSTDNSAAIGEDFTRGIPEYHFHQLPTHQGISAARNYGISHATGAAIAFVDGDDILQSTYVATLAAAFSAGVVATAVGYTWHWHRAQNTQPRRLDQREMFAQVSTHGSEVGGYVWNKAFSKSALDAIGLRFDESLPIAEDYLFTATFVAKTPGQYAYAPASLYTKINRPNSTIHTATAADRRIERQVFHQIHELNRSIR